MAIEPSGTAPYAPAQTVIDLIDGYRNRGFATPFTPDVLVRAGVPDSLVNRTLQALKLLDLIDIDGNPMDQFDALKQARGHEEFKSRLASWLTSAYADVLQYCDPATDTPERVGEAFRGYKPEGQRMRMVTLMLGLFAYAGIIEELPKRAPAPKKAPATPRTPAPAKKGGGTAARRAPRTPKAEISGLPPSIEGLLRDLPQNGGPWSRKRRDAWMETFTVVLNYAYPIDDSAGGPDREDVDDEVSTP